MTHSSLETPHPLPESLGPKPSLDPTKLSGSRTSIPNSYSLITVARQAPLSIGFSRQEHWSGLPCSPPGYLPDPGIEPASLTVSPARAGRFFTTSATWEALFFKGPGCKPLQGLDIKRHFLEGLIYGLRKETVLSTFPSALVKSDNLELKRLLRLGSSIEKRCKHQSQKREDPN